MNQNCKKQIRLRIDKEKEIRCMSNGKDMLVHLTDGLIKNTLHKNESIISSIIKKFWRKY